MLDRSLLEGTMRLAEEIRLVDRLDEWKIAQRGEVALATGSSIALVSSNRVLDFVLVPWLDG